MDKVVALRHRLWQAERALYNWPSDKNMDRVFFVKRALKKAMDPERKQTGYNLATAVWPPVPAE